MIEQYIINFFFLDDVDDSKERFIYQSILISRVELFYFKNCSLP